MSISFLLKAFHQYKYLNKHAPVISENDFKKNIANLLISASLRTNMHIDNNLNVQETKDVVLTKNNIKVISEILY